MKDIQGLYKAQWECKRSNKKKKIGQYQEENEKVIMKNVS